ncbi:hypothetical protein J2T13_002122 [Paenibacillus sp. DS2015]
MIYYIQLERTRTAEKLARYVWRMSRSGNYINCLPIDNESLKVKKRDGLATSKSLVWLHKRQWSSDFSKSRDSQFKKLRETIIQV